VSWHNAGEQALRESGVPWSFVRPGAFMSNALSGRLGPARGSRLPNFGDGRTAYPPARHRGRGGARAHHARAGGKGLALTGPQALSTGEQVQLLAAAIGRPLEYVPISDDGARGDGAVGDAGVPH
jgi:uncharacterized protein YbjT (DUF2867 family)